MDKIEQFKAPQIPDLDSPEERKRLSASGLRAFFKIMDRWHIADKDSCLLLNQSSLDSYFELKQHPEVQNLDTDTMMRISLFVGIYKALHLYFGNSVADEWIKVKNDNRLLGGTSPLNSMIQGGLPAMQYLRRLLDAWCAGNH